MDRNGNTVGRWGFDIHDEEHQLVEMREETPEERIRDKALEDAETARQEGHPVKARELLDLAAAAQRLGDRGSTRIAIVALASALKIVAYGCQQDLGIVRAQQITDLANDALEA